MRLAVVGLLVQCMCAQLARQLVRQLVLWCGARLYGVHKGLVYGTHSATHHANGGSLPQACGKVGGNQGECTSVGGQGACTGHMLHHLRTFGHCICSLYTPTSHSASHH